MQHNHPWTHSRKSLFTNQIKNEALLYNKSDEQLVPQQFNFTARASAGLNYLYRKIHLKQHSVPLGMTFKLSFWREIYITTLPSISNNTKY